MKNNLRRLYSRLAVLAALFIMAMLIFTACGGEENRGENGNDNENGTGYPPYSENRYPADSEDGQQLHSGETEVGSGTADPADPANGLPTQNAPYLAEPVIVGAGGEWPLNGLLTIPREANASHPVPAVVLVHGSGAHDMDSTMGGSRPFYDVAAYLSANGIAVLRYDKRNFAHSDALMTLAQRDIAAYGGRTVWDEAIEDALFGLALLREDSRIDPDRIYMLGLSLGAMLAPRIQIAAQSEGHGFAGLILMAGTPRELTEVILEQSAASINAGIERLPLFEGDDLAAAQAEIAHSQEILALLTEWAPVIWETPADAAKEMFWMGASFYYFQDLASPTFAEAAVYVTVSMLVQQGGRDFQVRADTDFALMQEILGSRDNVTFKLYENLNHLFMESSAENFVEHAIEIILATGPVEPQVLRDIADWILTPQTP